MKAINSEENLEETDGVIIDTFALIYQNSVTL